MKRWRAYDCKGGKTIQQHGAVREGKGGEGGGAGCIRLRLSLVTKSYKLHNNGVAKHPRCKNQQLHLSCSGDAKCKPDRSTQKGGTLTQVSTPGHSATLTTYKVLRISGCISGLPIPEQGAIAGKMGHAPVPQAGTGRLTTPPGRCVQPFATRCSFAFEAPVAPY